MATVGNAITPYTIPDPVDFVSQAIAQALPVPPLAWGFTELVEELGLVPFKRVEGYEAAALVAEGSHMERRIGQVWPR